MIEEIWRAHSRLLACYWYWNEKRLVRVKADEKAHCILKCLEDAKNYLENIDEAKEILKEIKSWIRKLENKYSEEQKLDDKDKKSLGQITMVCPFKNP